MLPCMFMPMTRIIISPVHPHLQGPKRAGCVVDLKIIICLDLSLYESSKQWIIILRVYQKGGKFYSYSSSSCTLHRTLVLHSQLLPCCLLYLSLLYHSFLYYRFTASSDIIGECSPFCDTQMGFLSKRSPPTNKVHDLEHAPLAFLVYIWQVTGINWKRKTTAICWSSQYVLQWVPPYHGISDEVLLLQFWQHWEYGV